MAVFGILKLILANSALALAISSYIIEAVGGLKTRYQYLCWILTYGIFTLLDIVGVRQSATAQVAATALCVLVLVLFSASCLSNFSFKVVREGGLIQDGMLGFMKGLPFALQFFDGFEEVPLLMSYAFDPEITIPKAILLSYATVAMIAIMVMVSAAGESTSTELLESKAPLMDGIDKLYGPDNALSNIIAAMIVVGLLVNFFAFVVFISQQVQAIAEAGQLPSILAYRNPRNGSPIVASICSSLVGLILTIGFVIVFGEEAAQNVLVTAALMPAILGYIIILEAIIKVRNVESRQYHEKLSPRDMLRIGYDPGPLRFVWGVIGARIAQIMCIFLAIALLVLAFCTVDFMYGLIVLGIFASIIYGLMYYYIRLNKDGKGEHQVLSQLDDEDDMLKSQYSAKMASLPYHEILDAET
jgi:amino acid transporter